MLALKLAAMARITSFANGIAFIEIPEENVREFASRVYDETTGLVKFCNVGWFTNIDHS